MATPDDAVEQERARLRALIDAMPDLVWMKDPEGRYISCNVRFEQLFGHTEAEIRGHTDFDFVSDELARFFRHHDQLAMQRDGPSVNEERLTFADGHQELTHTIKTPVRDRQGRLLGVLGIGRDITALREVEDEYRWLFERNPAPMLLYERQSLRLRRVNEAFCALYGLTPEQAQALLLTDLHLPEDRDAVRMRVAAHARPGERGRMAPRAQRRACAERGGAVARHPPRRHRLPHRRRHRRLAAGAQPPAGPPAPGADGPPGAR
jgi:PAS domain S-box-containing protein